MWGKKTPQRCKVVRKTATFWEILKREVCHPAKKVRERKPKNTIFRVKRGASKKHPQKRKGVQSWAKGKYAPGYSLRAPPNDIPRRTPWGNKSPGFQSPFDTRALLGGRLIKNPGKDQGNEWKPKRANQWFVGPTIRKTMSIRSFKRKVMRGIPKEE